jgi:hypothetical protein
MWFRSCLCIWHPRSCVLTNRLTPTALDVLERTSSEFDRQFDTALRQALDYELRRAPR